MDAKTVSDIAKAQVMGHYFDDEVGDTIPERVEQFDATLGFIRSLDWMEVDTQYQDVTFENVNVPENVPQTLWEPFEYESARNLLVYMRAHHNAMLGLWVEAGGISEEEAAKYHIV